jgi:phosphoribosyl-AMP cyclohydrolase
LVISCKSEFIDKDGNKVIELDFSKFDGLLPAVVQDYASGKVLMVAFMNDQAWQKTMETKEAHYWSRSRQTLWHKGGTSGHVQKVKEILVDCDDDTVVLKVEQIGNAACHTGYESCFHRRVTKDGGLEVLGQPVFDPKEVYST